MNASRGLSRTDLALACVPFLPALLGFLIAFRDALEGKWREAALALALAGVVPSLVAVALLLVTARYLPRRPSP